jgi:hypothetical protein
LSDPATSGAATAATAATASTSDRLAEGQRRSAALIELVISLAFIALGVFVYAIARGMPSTGGFSGIGPGAMPTVVGSGLIIVGLWLLAERLTGGWREAEAHPTERGEHGFVVSGFVWVSAGLIAQMLLINNAGVYHEKPFGELTEDEWFSEFNSTASAVYFTTRAFLPWLRASRGRVINIGDGSCDRLTARTMAPVDSGTGSPAARARWRIASGMSAGATSDGSFGSTSVTSGGASAARAVSCSHVQSLPARCQAARHCCTSQSPQTFLSNRVVPPTPPSLVKLRVRHSGVTSGRSSSAPTRAQVPRLT